MVMLPPAVAVPMVRFVKMTVTAVLAGIAAVAVVMMTWVLVGVATLPVGPPLPLICTWGDPSLAKKPGGYVSVILLPIGRTPPAVGVNTNVAEASVFHATRSAVAILNKLF